MHLFLLVTLLSALTPSFNALSVRRRDVH